LVSRSLRCSKLMVMGPEGKSVLNLWPPPSLLTSFT
jgi:hypothetical protein